MKPAIALAAATLLGGVGQSQIVVVDRSAPQADRWNYPFNATPGSREVAPSFGAVLIEGFDDRDAQFLVAFDTDPEAPAGLNPDQYHIRRAVFTAVVSNDDGFRYDPTFDSFRTHLDPGDPDFLPDADLGRPLELFGTGFRNGVTATTWTETSVFGGAPEVEPAQGARNAFAAVFDGAGVATDVSNNLKERFEATPWAIGTADLALGALVPIDTEFEFEVDLCVPGVREALRQGLHDGRLLLSLTSLQDASGGPGGGGGVVYPVWYTRDNILADLLGLNPTLHLEVRIGNPADLDANGVLSLDDIDAFISAFLAGSPEADITADCVLNLDDIDAFISAFLGG